MNRQDRAALRAAASAHERARWLASEAIDAELSTLDATWLSAHLSDCQECGLVADEYRSLHDELRGLALPEPPRDLWARTAAALDVADRSMARERASIWRRGLYGNRAFLGSAAAVGLTVMVVGLSLFSQGPLINPPSRPSVTNQIAAVSPSARAVAEAPVTVVDGNTYWVAPADGGYQIRGGSAECTGKAESCAVTGGTGTVLGSIASTSEVSVAIAPDAGQAAVWTDDKIVILPLTQTAPQTVSIDLLTPHPSAAPSAAPSASPSSAPSPSPVATNPSTPEATASAAPSATAGATGQSTPAPTAEPTAVVTPAPTGAVTPAPTAPPANTASEPRAILDGYRIVGRTPEFSADGLWVAFAARPADLSTGPDVYVWHAGWGSAVAVTSSHADAFAGWFGSKVLISEFATVQPSADETPVPTTEPTDSAAGPTTEPPTTEPPTASPSTSSAATVEAVSFVYDPQTGSVDRINRPMLMPVIDPTGRYLVYWAGTVVFDRSTGLWGPGEGQLYLDAWSNVGISPVILANGAAPTPTPEATPESTATPTETAPASATPLDTATPVPSIAASPENSAGPTAESQPSPMFSPADLPQILSVAPTPGAGRNWVVRWDATGQYVAIWVAGGGAADVGVVTLLNVASGDQVLNTVGVLLSKAARSNIQFDAQQFVYTSPGPGDAGSTYLFQLPATPPAPPATPEPVSTNGSGPDQSATASAAPIPTDRPGN